ncbi:6-phospho-3-hexuloisomerase [Paenibacillus sp. OAE614]|uniref:6-phospho-3-hexuloisomerase n=1 Tax=Paenibacillus sp. OAE614 TaxID=2663804 RepID=UPI0017894FEF
MNTADYALEITKELQRSIARISDGEADQLADMILEAGNVFVAGAGRSGLMGRALAMRLMHLGITAYVVGETVTPGIGPGDLLVIGSGSGETQSLVTMAKKAKDIGAAVVTATIHPDSTLGRLSDLPVRLPGTPKEQQAAGNGEKATIQPMGSLFEQTLIILYDAVVLRLMEQRDQDSSQMFGRHANLE